MSEVRGERGGLVRHGAGEQRVRALARCGPRPPGRRLLYERTEGWAAGLRLAALSLTGHGDPDRFAEEFSGSERTVAK